MVWKWIGLDWTGYGVMIPNGRMVWLVENKEMQKVGKHRMVRDV